MRRPVYPLHLLSSQHRFSGHGSLPTWGASWKCQATGIRSAQATVVSALEWRCSEVWSRASCETLSGHKPQLPAALSARFHPLAPAS